jgi:hypothetical protein
MKAPTNNILSTTDMASRIVEFARTMSNDQRFVSSALMVAANAVQTDPEVLWKSAPVSD